MKNRCVLLAVGNRLTTQCHLYSKLWSNFMFPSVARKSKSLILSDWLNVRGWLCTHSTFPIIYTVIVDSLWLCKQWPTIGCSSSKSTLIIENHKCVWMVQLFSYKYKLVLCTQCNLRQGHWKQGYSHQYLN